MWNPFLFENCNYLMKLVNKEFNLVIYLTNFKNIWIEPICKDNAISRFQELNPLLDTDSGSNTEINRIESLVNAIGLESCVSIGTNTNNSISVELRQKFEGVSIKYVFNLIIGNEDEFFTHFTLPLMQSVQYLEVRQKKLFDLLEKKDREIQEHQMERGELSRKNLVTKKFDRNIFFENIPEHLFVHVFGKSKPFLETFINKFGTVTNVKVKNTADTNQSNSSKRLKRENCSES